MTVYYESLNRRIRKLESLILEGKQVGTIYHVCSLGDYIKYILRNDTLSSSGLYRNALYNDETNWVSFTRNKNYVFNKHNVNALIRLVVDGDKLSDRYKIMPYNSLAAYSSYYAKEYGIDIGDMDQDELMDLGLIDDDEIEQVKDLPQNREQEEAVRGPIKNISKYIKEIQIDISSVDLVFINQLKKNLPLLSNVVYFNFISKSDKDVKLNEFLSSRIANGDSIDKLIKALDEYIELINKPKRSLRTRTVTRKVSSNPEINTNVNNQSNQFITLCKENNWKVKDIADKVVAFVPASDLGWYSSDNIKIFYNKDTDKISIFKNAKNYNLSRMDKRSFHDYMTELALS